MASKSLFLSLLFVLPAFAAEDNLSAVARVFDSQLTSAEREVVSLAEAMPAEKYNFAPKQGEFANVRTFAQQVSHIAAVNYEVAAAVLGEANPTQMGTNENGPASLQSKEAIVDYLKKSFTYTHKAMRSLSQENLMAQIKSAFGGNEVPRLTMATVPQWHTFDHYGQMAVYARMCGVIPPASRPRN
ncbi:MAG TPA: DinB family protein [Bryobacteraceae bacterium]